MSEHEQVTTANLENQAFALIARLHVILWREKGRVTDIEYMRNNPSYCRHVLGLIDAADSQEVRELGVRLDEIFFGQHGLFISKRAAPPWLARMAPAAPQTYIARLR